MKWIGLEEDFEPTKENIGFVYRITEFSTGKSYIGIKKFWKKSSLPPLKGKIRRRRKIVESNWKNYNSSSKILQQKIIKNPSDYKFEIIAIRDSVTEMKCLEAYLQLQEYVFGNWDKLYNEMINLRVRIRKTNGGKE